MIMKLAAFIVLASAALVRGQRPSFAGSKPIGYPEYATTEGSLEDRFGEVDGTTQRLPIEANGDRDLVDRLSKLPVDKQPFWFLNWQALEAHRQNPQTFPQKPNTFVDPLPVTGNANLGNGLSNPSPSNLGNSGFSNLGNSGSPNLSNSGSPNLGNSGSPNLSNAASPNFSNSGSPNAGNTGSAFVNSSPVTAIPVAATIVNRFGEVEPNTDYRSQDILTGNTPGSPSVNSKPGNTVSATPYYVNYVPPRRYFR